MSEIKKEYPEGKSYAGAIVDIVFSYIDRMNDPTPDDPMDKIAREFVEAVNPVIDDYLNRGT
jgi:hypothetical protein